MPCQTKVEQRHDQGGRLIEQAKGMRKSQFAEHLHRGCIGSAGPSYFLLFFFLFVFFSPPLFLACLALLHGPDNLRAGCGSRQVWHFPEGSVPDLSAPKPATWDPERLLTWIPFAARQGVVRDEVFRVFREIWSKDVCFFVFFSRVTFFFFVVCKISGFLTRMIRVPRDLKICFFFFKPRMTGFLLWISMNLMNMCLNMFLV